jgi:hypothetical protein
MAARADLAVDLEAALQLLRIVFPERPGEGPVDMLRVQERIMHRRALVMRILLREDKARRERQEENGGEPRGRNLHRHAPPISRAFPARRGL